MKPDMATTITVETHGIEWDKPKATPKRGFICNLRRMVRRLRCSHGRTFEFFPAPVWWNRDGKRIGTMTHGAKVTCCMDCGETWGSDYAE
jgi:hypothetical protein